MEAFLFGDDSQIAMLYYNNIIFEGGPGVPDVHPDEMTHQELIDCMVYTAMAATEAREGGQLEAAKILHTWYDEMFVRVVSVDKKFRERLTSATFFPLKAGFDRNKGYYLRLAAKD